MKIAEFKIRLIFIFALSIALSSCSKSEDVVDSEMPRVPMVFSNRTPDAVEDDTKTGEKTSSNWKDGDSFGVYASLGKGFAEEGGGTWGDGAVWIMTNKTVTAKVTGNDAIWSYPGIQYWPLDPTNKITFVAYHPNSTTAGSVSTAPTVGYPGFLVTFKVNETPALQEDLLYDVIKNATRLNPNGDSGTGGAGTPTKFTFEHALSKISFKVKKAANYDNISNINLTSLTVTGLYNSGIFSMTSNLASPHWFKITGTTDREYTVNGTKPLTTTSATCDEYLLLIPQLNSTMKITANYDVHYLNGPSDKIVKDTYTWTVGTDTGDIPKITWAMQTHYTYSLKIGLTDIDFAAEVTATEWLDHHQTVTSL